MINIILYQCEKPANLGNIMRTIAATKAKLHIIGPLSFSLDDDALLRAGMDYICNNDYIYYSSLDDFMKIHGDKNIYCITRYGDKPPSIIDFSKVYEDYFIMFGKESTGLPIQILKRKLENCLRLPMASEARSLNLANCVAIVVYEVLRQQNYYGLSTEEVLKR